MLCDCWRGHSVGLWSSGQFLLPHDCLGMAFSCPMTVRTDSAALYLPEVILLFHGCQDQSLCWFMLVRTSYCWPIIVRISHSVGPSLSGPVTLLAHCCQDQSFCWLMVVRTSHSAGQSLSVLVILLAHGCQDQSFCWPRDVRISHSAGPLLSGHHSVGS